MAFSHILKAFLALLVLQGITSFNLNELNKMKIENVERTCDLQTQYAKFESTLTIKNNGDDNVKTFYFTVPKRLEHKLFLLTFKAKRSQEALKYKIIENFALKQKSDATLYEVTLNNFIPSQEKLQVVVEEQYYNRMSPFPTHITLMVISLFFSNPFFFFQIICKFFFFFFFLKTWSLPFY